MLSTHLSGLFDILSPATGEISIIFHFYIDRSDLFFLIIVSICGCLFPVLSACQVRFGSESEHASDEDPGRKAMEKLAEVLKQ